MFDNNESSEKDWAFFIVACVLLSLNIIGWVMAANASKTYENMVEEHKTIEAEYDQYDNIFQYGQSNDDLQRKLEDLQVTIKDGIERLKKALFVFVYREILGLLVGSAIIIIGVFYKIQEEEFLSKLRPDNIVNAICEILILFFFIYDIISPFMEVGDYIELLNEYKDVLYSVLYKISVLI